ncbi:MAG: 5-formyltetrahydrofolate cyclo-ligase [Phycisphaerales bacterium]
MDPGGDESVPVGTHKRALRTEMRGVLSGVSIDEHRCWSAGVCDHIAGSPEFDRAGVVAVFGAIPGEVDLTGLVVRALKGGKRVAWPRVSWDTGAMEMVAMDRADWASGGGGVGGRFGLVEPSPEFAGLSMDDLVGARPLVLAPGLAFDREGRRLGRGAGFYDRFLGAMRSVAGRAPGARFARGVVALGVCFGVQLVERVPADANDEAMDAIVTEHGLIICS